jgi:hypothetical protein
LTTRNHQLHPCLKSKRYHIGSMRFGGGGLTALIAVGLLAVSGSGAVAYTVFQELAAQALTRPQEPAQARSGLV